MVESTPGQDHAALAGHTLDLDLDTTVKCLYGKQEGAVVGYNPHKPGRPSHRYHSALMANTRLALGVEVMPANASAPSAQHAQDLGLARCLTGCRTSGPLAR